MTDTYLAVQNQVVLDNLGNGKVSVSPALAGQFWFPTLVHVSTQSSPAAGQVITCNLYVSIGGSTSPTGLRDSTNTGNFDTTSILSGEIIQPGFGITAQFINGNPGDTAFISVIGISSDVPPAQGIQPGIPGTHFSGAPLQTLDVFVTNPLADPIPVEVVLTATSPLHVVLDEDIQQYANQLPMAIGVNPLAAGGTAHILPATVGRQYILHELNIFWDTSTTNSQLNVQTTTGTVLDSIFFAAQGTINQIIPYLPPRKYYSAKLPVGQGLDIVSLASVGGALFGTIVFSF